MTLSLPAALSRPSVSIALALVAGALYPLAFAPYHYWWMLYPVVAGFFLALTASSRPLLTVWCFGLAKYAFGASWIYVSINVYGGASPLLATLLVAIFVSGMALFYLPMGWLFRLLRPGTVLGCVVVFGWGWHLKDWLLGWFLTGFPWLYPGYALTESVMAGLLPLVGVLSAGTLVVLCTLGLPLAWLSWRDMHRQRALVLIGIAVTPLLLGWLANQVNWTQASGSMQVALVQGNIDQATKWNPERRVPNLRVHEELSESHWQEVDLMVWPEAAITMFSQQAGSYLEDLNAQALRSNTDLVTGIPGADVYPDGSWDFKNLAVGMGRAQGRFAKEHLVPFGEYVPLQEVLRGLIQFFDLPMSNATPGVAGQPNLQLSMGAASMGICYEVAYADSMRQRTRDAVVMMTLSNDTWFGSSIGPHQHLQIARARALENGRWMLRATNNGITALIDERGRVVAQAPQFEPVVLRGEAQTREGSTPYALMGELWTGLLLVLGAGFVLMRRATL